ncbi:hypothetical protein ACFV6V_28775, partial [Streptomyces sp. NPDC059828]
MHTVELEKRAEPAEAEGCLTVAVRIPVRIVVLLVVVPVRMAWDLLVVCAKLLDRVLLRPLRRALAYVYATVLVPVGQAVGWVATLVAQALFHWPWVALWRYVIVPVATYGIAMPLLWLYRKVLTPLGHGLVWVYRVLVVPLGRGAGWLVWAVFVWPWTALYRWVLTPLGHGLVWVYRVLVVPLGRGAGWLVWAVFV